MLHDDFKLMMFYNLCAQNCPENVNYLVMIYPNFEEFILLSTEQMKLDVKYISCIKPIYLLIKCFQKINQVSISQMY